MWRGFRKVEPCFEDVSNMHISMPPLCGRHGTRHAAGQNRVTRARPDGASHGDDRSRAETRQRQK